LNRLQHNGLLSGLKLRVTSRGITPTFADDFILLGELNTREIDCISQALEVYCQASGQKINAGKI